MPNHDKVRVVVARFFGVADAVVTDDFVFPPERLHGSVGRATLHAAIKRMAGVDLPMAFSANNFGELINPLVAPAKNGGPVNLGSAEMAPGMAGGSSSDLGIGIDIEHCDHLPVSSDPWNEPFYAEHFTPAEIAYCLRQPDPRESFCGLWSAKEAVKKCGAEFLRLRPVEIEIGHDDHGRPFVAGGPAGQLFREKRCLISISHSRGTSAAVCVSGLGQSAATAVISCTNFPAEPAEAGGARLVWLGLGLGLLNLVLWLVFHVKK